jgi:hypothetical protein
MVRPCFKLHLSYSSTVSSTRLTVLVFPIRLPVAPDSLQVQWLDPGEFPLER